MTPKQLLELTANLPCKQIEVNGQPYLQRYFLGEDANGQAWLHRFMRADSERHLHTHPWTGTSMILCGRYTEQLRPVGAPNSGEQDRIRYLSAGDVNQITPQTTHRIVDVEPETWTILHIRPKREPTWSFVADDGALTHVPSSPYEWHEGLPTRDQLS